MLQAITVDAAQPAAHSVSASPRLQSLRRYIAEFLATCADYNAAAAIYEELSGLSDDELRRRGLSRATLGRDICEALDRMS